MTPYERKKLAGKIKKYSTEKVERNDLILVNAGKNTEIAREAVRDFHFLILEALAQKKWEFAIFKTIASQVAKKFRKNDFTLDNDAVFSAQWEVYKFNIAFESQELFEKFLRLID